MIKKIRIIFVLALFAMSYSFGMHLDIGQSVITRAPITDDEGNRIVRYIETTAEGITEADFVTAGPRAGTYSVELRTRTITHEGTFSEAKEFFGEEAQSIFNDLEQKFRAQGIEKG